MAKKVATPHVRKEIWLTDDEIKFIERNLCQPGQSSKAFCEHVIRVQIEHRKEMKKVMRSQPRKQAA